MKNKYTAEINFKKIYSKKAKIVLLHHWRNISFEHLLFCHPVKLVLFSVEICDNLLKKMLTFPHKFGETSV